MATGGTDQDTVQGHDEYFDSVCTRCENRGISTEATHYCASCGKYFCDGCETLHGEFSPTHATLNATRRGEWGIQLRAEVVMDTEACPHHTDQQVSMYCGQHEEVCCLICDSLNHRNCEAKGYLLELAQGVTQSAEMTALMSDIRRTERDFEIWRQLHRRQRTRLWDSRTRFQEAVSGYKARLVTLVENLERRANEQMEELYNNRDQELLEKLNKSNEIMQGLDDVRTRLDGSTADSKIFIEMKHGKDKLLECRQWLLGQSRILDYEITFSLDETPHQHIERSNAIGAMDLNVLLSSRPIKSLDRVREIRIRQETDTSTCIIKGICQMLDGTLILGDHNNANLKRFDKQFTVKEVYPMPGNPNGLCCIDKKEIAVALGSKKTVQFVTVTDRLRIKEALSFQHNCNAIAYKSGMLYITGNFVRTLFIYQINRGNNETTCTRIRVIEGNIDSVAVSLCGNYVYYTDMDNTLAISDSTGRQITKIIHPDLVKLDYKSVCVDNKGNVMVALKRNGIVNFKDAGFVANGRLLQSADTGMPDYVFVDCYSSKLIFQRNGAFGGSETICVCKIVYA